MPLNPLSFLNTAANTPEGKNWRTLDLNTKTLVRTDLTMTAPVGTPTVNAGYFTMYGPIVFYVIKLTLNNTEGWTALGSYIKIPYAEFIFNSIQQVTHSGHVIVGATGGAITTTILLTADTSKLAFTGAYTNTTGADQVVFLQGWYFRN